MTVQPTRRTFLRRAAATTMTGALLSTAAAPSGTCAAVVAPRLRKAIKYDSLKLGSSIEDRFNILKSIGFEGVEINSPSTIDREAAVAAWNKTGIQIHGVIDSAHWKDCLSDPDEAIRARGLDALRTALNDAKFYGATTVLLVPGKVTDAAKDKGTGKMLDAVTFDQCWSRSADEIRKALPLAEQLGVKIAIEVVWNNFITKPEQFVKYIDQFQSPWVGGYFDCSNMIKFGVPSADWIRALGPRMAKFDFKGYSKKNGWVKIGEGDEDWPEILKALDEVGYRSWATAEVGANNLDELKDIYARMSRCLGA
jgi:L-ribulose-5-phosphate 3-epimerase